MTTAVETKLEVRWGECDPAGIVYHPAYIDWFSVARMHFLSAYGVHYMESFHDGRIQVVVTDVTCKYVKTLRAEDQIVVVARLVEISRARMKFAYEVFDDSGATCAKGYTRHAFVEHGTMRPVNLQRTAPELWEKLTVLPLSPEE
ncbi:acyl-CoA thioesterase [Alicyclobacillus fastidiosus]|uniref:Acyl-CoA thioesterase n=1 Tax=Alicyclobacillus fastidiosus TaxID=392011 RepID=A0ABV5AIS5_9BACL|nr:acyl-CoA thioesterase [Alicyclobacillus fastidiosus]WEH11146.1 acyl-CoA thioesterase [Alicyclobacillus fastidiosus]